MSAQSVAPVIDTVPPGPRKWAHRMTRFVCAGTLAALSSLACADEASVSISNVKVQVVDMNPGDNIWPWAWFVSDVSWVPQTTGALAHVESPVASDTQRGWLGSVHSANAASGGSLAQATTSGGDFSALGPGASASVSVLDGQQGWASADVFNGRFLAGAQTRIVVTAMVDSILASGSSAQANAMIDLCFGDGSCSPSGYSEALAFGFPAFGNLPPSMLRAEWENRTDDSLWGTMNVSVSAAASPVSAVPEPTSTALLLSGLLVCAGIARRRQ